MENITNKDNIKTFIRRAEGIIEALLLTIVFYYIWKHFYRLSYTPPYFGRGKYILIGVYFVLSCIVYHMCEAFMFGRLKFQEIFISSIVANFVINFITYFEVSLISNVMVPAGPMFIIFAIDIAISGVCCFAFTALYHQIHVPHNMLLIYGSGNAIDLKFKMEKRQDRYTITEMIKYDEGMRSVIEAISRHDSCIINDVPAVVRNDIVKYCYEKGIRTYVVPKISDIMIQGASDITLFDTPLLLVKGTGIMPDQEFIKRVMDIMLCIIALIPFLIVFVITAIAIKLDDHGSVFFCQDRVTKNGKVFKMYKFRSMKEHNEEEETYDGAEENDPRITRVGRVIRRFRIDEVPQIINIIKGDMSWVGPRAEHTVDIERRSKEVKEYKDRLKVKAGLTGYAQVYGKYNTSSYDKLRLDLMYIEKYSLLLDIKLILMTIRILFKKESTEGMDKARELKEKSKKSLENE